MLGKIFRSRVWLALLLTLALGLSVTIFLRKDIAAWALTSGLEVRGLEVSSLAVTRLGWQRSSVRALAAQGPGVSVAVEAIDLDYRLFDLLSGALPAVSLSGADLSLDLDSPLLKGRGADAGSAPAESESPSESKVPAQEAAPLQALPELPDVTIADSRIRLITPIGPLEVALEGALSQMADGGVQGSLSLDAQGGQGQSKATAEFAVTPDLSLQADLKVEEGSFDIGELMLRGMTGRFDVALDGPSRKLGKLDARLTLAQVSGGLSPSVALAPLRLSLEGGLEREDVVFTFAATSAGSSDTALQTAIQGRITPGPEAVTLTVSSSLKSPASLPLFSKFHLPLPKAGQIAGKAGVKAVLPPLAELQALKLWSQPLQRWLQALISMETDFALRSDDLWHPDYLEGLTLDIAGRAALDDRGFALNLTTPVSAELSALSEELLKQVSLPEDLQNWATGPLKLTLGAVEGEPVLRAARADVLTGPYSTAAVVDLSAPGFSVSATSNGELLPGKADWALSGPIALEARKIPLRGISGAKGRFDLDLVGAFESTNAGSSVSGDLKAGADALVKDDTRIAGLRVSAPIRGGLSAEAVRLVTTGPAVASAKGLSTAVVSSTMPLKLDISAADMTVDLMTGLPRPIVAAQLAPGAFVLGAAEEAVPLETEVLDLEVSPATGASGRLLLKLDTAGMSLPDYDLRAADIALRAEVSPETGEAEGRFTGLRLEDTAAARRFDDVFLDGDFRQDQAGRLDFNMSGRSFQDAITFEAKGKSVPGQGLAEVTLPPHDFARTPLSLEGLSWISDALVEEGTMSGSLSVEMSPQGPVGFAKLSSEGLSGTALGFPFADLSLIMDLDGLWPPRTARPIEIALERFNPGLPISDLQVKAALPAAEAFRLDLNTAAFSLLGARISVDGARLALLEGTADLPIRITGLDLAEVLKAADLADVDISGRLAGDLPVSLDDGVVTLRQSKLTATEPGVLRVRSEEVASLLTGYGDEVNSMLRALEDFYYDDLSLTLEKTADDDLMLLLSILGKNPAVLDGQSFRVNLNLESNIGQILDTLGEGLEISKDLLSGRYSLQ
ncbi:intermembrane phospholipid transport protein YdbH family protein [Denitrobaculum tricleocarpae]|uniref:Uncharacterized protein n=1 Tax=Denitrobaculum tricleocarpae TaxID=2591009 RepID=A0A545U2M1_9PROT|nr:YdbH domain-containing protein [Denitrobaculum tricleocarpae]TQV83684.1 hypothetical protein FKG95_03605 [Denitrobaculum tricleocarpae]